MAQFIDKIVENAPIIVLAVFVAIVVVTVYLNAKH